MSNAYLNLSQVDMTFTGNNGVVNPVLKGIDLGACSAMCPSRWCNFTRKTWSAVA